MNVVLAWITAQLGLVSCDNGILGGGEVCMYGMPTADYTLSLKVKDEAGKPIANQKVLVRPVNYNGEVHENEYYNTDTVTTDRNGSYEGAVENRYGWWPAGTKGMRIVVDEPVDPMLAPDSVTVSVKQIKKGDGWYEGTFEGKAELTLKVADCAE